MREFTLVGEGALRI